jgi:hypothetical protein
MFPVVRQDTKAGIQICMLPWIECTSGLWEQHCILMKQLRLSYCCDSYPRWWSVKSHKTVATNVSITTFSCYQFVLENYNLFFKSYFHVWWVKPYFLLMRCGTRTQGLMLFYHQHIPSPKLLLYEPVGMVSSGLSQLK